MEKIYTMRIDEDDWARCGCCGHKLYQLIGRNGAIKIKCHSCKNINITERRICRTCRWLSNGVCMNEASEMLLQEKTDNQSCETWEQREKETKR